MDLALMNNYTLGGQTPEAGNSKKSGSGRREKKAGAHRAILQDRERRFSRESDTTYLQSWLSGYTFFGSLPDLYVFP